MAVTEQALGFILKKNKLCLFLRTFSEISKAEDQYSLCQELCRELAQDLQKEGLKVFFYSIFFQRDTTLHSKYSMNQHHLMQSIFRKLS